MGRLATTGRTRESAFPVCWEIMPEVYLFEEQANLAAFEFACDL